MSMVYPCLASLPPTRHHHASTVYRDTLLMSIVSFDRVSVMDLMHQSAWTCTKDSDPVVPSSVLLTRASQILIVQSELSLAVRFTSSSITAVRIIFEVEISVRKALMFVCQPVTRLRTHTADNQDHNQLSYHVGDSLRRLWVRRATYTSGEWVCRIHPPIAATDHQAIISEHQVNSPADKLDHFPGPLTEYCRNHPSSQHLSDESNLAIGPLPPTTNLNNIPQQLWRDTSRLRDHFPIPRKPLKSQNDAFDVSGYKTARN